MSTLNAAQETTGILLGRSGKVGCAEARSASSDQTSTSTHHRPQLTVVQPRRILDRDRDAVVPSAALAKVVVLEVERRLREAVDVRNVVHAVDDVERVRACGVDVDLDPRVLVRVLHKDEVQAARRLRGRVSLGALESNRIIAAASPCESGIGGGE